MENTEELTQNVLNDLQNRLKSIMGYLKQINPENFNNQTRSSKSLNIDRSNLSAALNGDPRYLKKDSTVITAIFNQFPELSKEWFFYGIGTMLIGKESIEIDSSKRKASKTKLITTKEFDNLPVNKQLSLIWDAILDMNKSLESRVTDQDKKIVKVIEFIEDKVTPMYEYIKMNEERK